MVQQSTLILSQSVHEKNAFRENVCSFLHPSAKIRPDLWSGRILRKNMKKMGNYSILRQGNQRSRRPHPTDHASLLRPATGIPVLLRDGCWLPES